MLTWLFKNVNFRPPQNLNTCISLLEVIDFDSAWVEILAHVNFLFSRVFSLL